MTLFEFIDSLFDKKAYSEVTDRDKKTYYFNLNRFLSHKYPLEVNEVNNIIGISRDHVPYMVDYWQRFLITKFNRKPDFFFWKTSVEAVEKTFVDKFDKDVITGYLRSYRISKPMFEVMCNIFPKEVEMELKMYKDTLEAKSRKNPKKKA